MSFLIDGYNFLFRIEGLKKGSLEKKRDEFIHVLDEQLVCFKLPVYIVFDSAQQMSPYAQCRHCQHLDVLYAPKGKTADEYILELIEISRTPKILIVVTSDTGLARQSHALGARSMSVEDFVLLIVKRVRKGICRRAPSYTETPSEMQRLLRAFERRLTDMDF